MAFAVAVLLISCFSLTDLKSHSNLSSKTVFNDLPTDKKVMTIDFMESKKLCDISYLKTVRPGLSALRVCETDTSTASNELYLLKMLYNKLWNVKKGCFLVGIGRTQLLLFGYSIPPQKPVH